MNSIHCRLIHLVLLLCYLLSECAVKYCSVQDDQGKCKKSASFSRKNKEKTGIILPLSYIIVLFYTKSFTRNRQQVQDILCYGVENVGDFFYLFFVGKGGDGPEVAKHRTSLVESTDILH